MGDQVQFLNDEPPVFQIGAPGAPCGGSSTCTDTCGVMIVFHETGRTITARQFRQAAAPTKDPCRGLNPLEFCKGLRAFGVKGYAPHYGATVEDAIKATDNGIVVLCVGYDGYPTRDEAEVGGKTDIQFTGSHAVTLWGRRNWQQPPASWPNGKTFKPGWRNWLRDPDHHWGDKLPVYDRFTSDLTRRAMQAIVGNSGWTRTCAIWKGSI